MSEIKLLPCPFCGGEARLMSVLDDGEVCINYEDELDMDYSFVHCYNCDMDFMPHTETAREVLEAWNTRKPMERIVERLERHRKTYEMAIEKTEDELLNYYRTGIMRGYEYSIDVVKEEGGIDA